MLGVAFVAALVGLSQSSTQKIYMSCEVSSRPGITKADVYRTVPTNSEQFSRDMLEFGTISLFTSPADTWIVDLANESVRPTGNDIFVFKLLQISDTEIVAHRSSQGGNDFLLQIDRISGVASHTTMMSPAKKLAWFKRYGKQLPSMWTWKQRCTGAPSPRF